MGHILVVGGTGMLTGFCVDMTKVEEVVSVVGRNLVRFDRLAKKCEGNIGKINPVITDYSNIEELTDQLKHCFYLFGTPTLIVSWIHSPSAGAHETIMRLTKQASCDYYYLSGSLKSEKLLQVDEVEQMAVQFTNINFHKVVLGFIKEANSKRWLTNEEISKGVLKAALSGEKVSVVGVLE